MGNLRDEILKLFPGGSRREKERSSAVVSARTEPAPATADKGSEDDWKAGVTPLAQSGPGKPNETIIVGRPETSLMGKLRLPWGRRAIPPIPAPRASGSKQAPSPAIARQVKSASLSSLPQAKPQVKSLAPNMRFGDARPPSLTREQEFRTPKSWVAAGAALQPALNDGGRVMPVRIGIDFGTAYTKVAIRIADRVLFVPWTGIRESGTSNFFLPGEITISTGGALWLGRAPDAEEVRTDLKLPFLSRMAGSNEQRAAVVAFLAWTMRYARAWLFHAHAPLLRGRRLAWEVNLGCPANSWAAKDISDSYQGLAVRAWQLSQSAGIISWGDAVSSLAPLQVSLGDIGLDGLRLMPEFVAQIAGYVQSPQRRNGLHMLMDVGAGTVDIATFNVHYDEEKEEDRFPIFASEVLPLGTHFLMAERLRKAGLKGRAWDDLQSVPEAEGLSLELKADVNAINASDGEFANRVAGAVQRIVHYTRERRYGRAPEWRTGVPVFLSGGGSDCPIYSRALEAGFRRINVLPMRTPFPLLEETLRNANLTEEQFHRLSVAYGLTFDADAMGRILAPHEVDDAPRLDGKVDTPRERPDRDDLYPK